MRILRGLSSRFLPCGCLAGIYETYEGEIVGIVDAHGMACAEPAHASGNLVPLEPSDSVAGISPPADSITPPETTY
jgi:hypothetical protein